MAGKVYINNYFKYKWTKCSNQKTQSGWMDKKKKKKTHKRCLHKIYVKCKNTQTENEGMEKGFIMQAKTKRK